MAVKEKSKKRLNSDNSNEPNKKYKSNNKCVICFENLSTCAIIPCGHKILCEDCCGYIDLSKEDLGSNAIDALAKGASDGLKLALNIAAMLLAFLAVVYMLNYFLEFFGDITSINEWIKASSNGQFNKLSMEFLLGQVFRVFAFMIGIDWNETVLVGSLLGQKFVLNEFIAYVNLAEMKTAGFLSEKSILISTYALCGFANFSSIAIQIGGIGSMAQSRQKDISKLGLRALLAATLATLLTGNIAGFIIA